MRLVAVAAVIAVGCGVTSTQSRFAQQRPSAEPASSSSASAVTPPEEARAAAIRGRFGNSCRLARECAGMWGIDCDAAVDGPFYYVEAQTLKVVARCGGYCDGARCTECPPRTWTCATQ
jgi:hypothetical protein